jgi:hypothetical protein
LHSNSGLSGFLLVAARCGSNRIASGLPTIRPKLLSHVGECINMGFECYAHCSARKQTTWLINGYIERAVWAVVSEGPKGRIPVRNVEIPGTGVRRCEKTKKVVSFAI